MNLYYQSHIYYNIRTMYTLKFKGSANVNISMNILYRKCKKKKKFQRVTKTILSQLTGVNFSCYNTIVLNFT